MHTQLRNLIVLLLITSVAVAVTDVATAQDNSRRPAETFDAATLAAPFSSIAVREKDVFAANDNGLFRASLEDKQWKRLPIPQRMPVAGAFGQAPKSSEHLYYHSRGRNQPDPNFDHGLYHSIDSGQTWRLVSSEHDFQKVYLHRDGSLYAIIERRFAEADKKCLRYCILRAPTLESPLKWQDITGDIGRNVLLYDIIEDPAHPNLIRLRGESIRSYIIHAADKNYRWEMTYDSPVERRKGSDDAFLAPEGSATKILYLHQATLENYFDHPFGNSPEIHAWSLHTEADSFTFARDEPKIVRVSIRFLKDNLTVTIPDVRDELDCWSLRLVNPAGEQITILARGHELVWRDSKKRAKYRTRGDLLSVDVSREHPYRRSIDLGKLADFSQPGQYRLRLSYHSDWLAESEEWSGSFSSDILTITVR